MSPPLLFALIWYVTGVGGFLWWWTEDQAVDGFALAEGCMAGVLGPLTLLLGFCVHRLMEDDVVKAEAPLFPCIPTPR